MLYQFGKAKGDTVVEISTSKNTPIYKQLEQIREEIKKSSNVPYLNEYSNFDNIDEYMQDIIYLNIYKQRFIYFYAMTRYKLSNEISKENSDVVSRPNKINNKREKEKRDNYLNEAIILNKSNKSYIFFNNDI